MDAFKVLATNHTSFTVSDLDRTTAFLEQGLGFEVISRAPRNPDLIRTITGVDGADIEVVFVQAPGHRIELIQYKSPPERDHVTARPCDTGFAHLAFDVDDIDAAIAASAPFGVHPYAPPTVIDRGPNTGNRVAYLKDGDGITIEFIEKSA